MNTLEHWLSQECRGIPGLNPVSFEIGFWVETTTGYRAKILKDVTGYQLEVTSLAGEMVPLSRWMSDPLLILLDQLLRLYENEGKPQSLETFSAIYQLQQEVRAWWVGQPQACRLQTCGVRQHLKFPTTSSDYLLIYEVDQIKCFTLTEAPSTHEDVMTDFLAFLAQKNQALQPLAQVS